MNEYSILEWRWTCLLVVDCDEREGDYTRVRTYKRIDLRVHLTRTHMVPHIVGGDDDGEEDIGVKLHTLYHSLFWGTSLHNGSIPYIPEHSFDLRTFRVLLDPESVWGV